MKNKNVLILSAGRRVELVLEFKESLEKYFKNSLVIATDMRPDLSSACQVAHKCFQVPRVTDPLYIKYIKSLCAENDVGLVIPTIDTELLLLSRHKEEFLGAGIFVVVADSCLIDVCRDKRKTGHLFASLNIDSPAIYEKDNLQFPCFCKPYDGSCSIGAFPILHEKMLTDEVFLNEKNIFMELIGKEYKEYTVDAYYDKTGTLKCLVPRERLEVRGGEVSKGITRFDAAYDYLVTRLCNLKNAVGCITVQIFFNPLSGSIKGLEVNPRFGGGYPLSYAAGANYPEWLIQEYFLGVEISFFDAWNKNCLMLRYDAQVLVNDYPK